MNMMQAMRMMQDPQGYVSQQAMQQAMRQMVNENPEAWRQANEKYGNMDRKKMLAALKKEYARQGQDLEQVAAQLGIPLN